MVYQNNTVTILLVEDDDVDIESIKRSFRKMRIANPMIVASDGIEALEILRGQNNAKSIKRPFMIILDLNMPRMNGFEFLEVLRDDEKLADSICFVLTTSDADRDKLSAYEKHIAGYIVKSRVGVSFTAMIEMMECYWKVVEFPPDRRL